MVVPRLLGAMAQDVQKTCPQLSKGTQTIGPDHIKTEYGTMAAVAASVLNGAHIVRVHDVEKVKSFTHIIDSIRNAKA